MTAHVDEDTLQAFVTAALDGDAAARVEAHLDDCDVCRQLHAELGRALGGDVTARSSSPQAGEHLAKGQVVGRYTVVEPLGAGAMGVVYAAFDPDLERRVALKLVHLEAVRPGSSARARVLREAKAIAKLSHPNVIAVHDFGIFRGEIFLAMELAEGGTLRERVAAKKPTWGALRDMLVQAGRGLAAAHSAGLVHRDFKPDNVLVGADGVVKVADFGLASVHDEARGAAVAPDMEIAATLTQTGTLLGTPAYMAPEQMRGERADARSDIFAFSVAAYELFYGERPFDGKTVEELRRNVEAGRVSEPLDGAGVPAWVHRAILRGLSARPEDRYASMDELLAALTAGPPRSWRSLLRWASAALALASVGAAFAWGNRERYIEPSAAAGPEPIAPLASSDATLACPLLDAPDLGPSAGWYGAAAATIACSRAKWLLGGSEERVFLPADLLGISPRPTEDSLDDPFTASDARARTLAAATRATAMLDGTVRRERDALVVSLRLARPDGSDASSARGVGRAASLSTATAAALDELQAAGGLPRATRLVPEAARWLGSDDVDDGIALGTLLELEHGDVACARLRDRQQRLGALAPTVARLCREGDASPWTADPPLRDVDPSSLAAHVWSVHELYNEERLPDAGGSAADLERLASAATTRTDRAYLALAEGEAWLYAKDRDRARAALLHGLDAQPHLAFLWYTFTTADYGSAGSGAAYRAAAIWVPYDTYFLPHVTADLAELTPTRLRSTERAYALVPSALHAALWGRALVDAGRREEGRSLAARAGPGKPTGELLLARVDASEAKLGKAFERLRGVHGPGLVPALALADLLTLAELLGRREQLGAQRAKEVPDEMPSVDGGHDVLDIGVCIFAPRDAALACLDALEAKRVRNPAAWSDGAEVLIAGGRRYARGDIRGAVSTWRPLVASHSPRFARVLPTEAFETAGEGELAEKLDARKASLRFLAGESVTLARDAKRALRAGDVARAKDLARRAVDAWATADVDVPALADMRRLLRGR